MANKKNTKVCHICGKQYEYCTSCSGVQSADYWKSAWCSENCKAISSIIANYAAEQITANDARTQLGKCDLTQIATFKAMPKQHINDILNGTSGTADKSTKTEKK